MKYIIPLLLALASCTQQPIPNQLTGTSTSTSTTICPPGSFTKSLNADGSVVCETIPTLPPSGGNGSIPSEKPPARVPTAAELKGCPAKGDYQAFDRVGYSDQKFVDVMRHLGMDKVAIRYYDWIGQESLSGKIPTDAEMDVYKKNGIAFVGVFQHFNSSLSTFESSSRPAKDVGEVLKLAAKWKQPKDSAVYFGYDGDFTYAQVKSYAEKVAKGIRAAGFRVGMYGNGHICEELAKAGLIDRSKDAHKKPLCFIAASAHGWRGTKDILKTKNYVIEQKVNQTCAGKSIDFDKLLAQDVGQWSIQ